MYSTLHSTSQKKTKENETPMIQKWRKMKTLKLNKLVNTGKIIR